jgi:hypothetical protein
LIESLIAKTRTWTRCGGFSLLLLKFPSRQRGSEIVCRHVQCHGRALGGRTIRHATAQYKHAAYRHTVGSCRSSIAVLSTPAQAAAAKHRVVHTAAVKHTAHYEACKELPTSKHSPRHWRWRHWRLLLSSGRGLVCGTCAHADSPLSMDQTLTDYNQLARDECVRKSQTATFSDILHPRS